jgi:hypothetical protein
MPTHRSSGKDYITVDHTSEVVRAWLYNFGIGKSELKQDHKELLDTAIGPVNRLGGSIALLGLASTTGTLQRDFELGSKRIHAVTHYLRSKFGSQFLVTKHPTAGKVMALAFEEAHLAGGTKDNTESPLWRAVVINAWNRALTPPPPVGSDADPFNNPNYSVIVGKVLDTAAGLLGIIDVAAEIFDLAIAAAASVADLIVGPIAALASLPLTWGNADFFAEKNGEIQGKADAIQDMADQYNDSTLDQKRLADWPAVKVPELHGPVNPQPNAFQIFWHQGQMEGRKKAVEAILEMEQHPIPIKLSNGKNFKYTGRIWLRAMSKAFGDNVGVEVVIKPVNEQLKKQGMPPFPTHPIG